MQVLRCNGPKYGRILAVQTVGLGQRWARDRGLLNYVV